ncbi:MAG: acetylornithine/succinylornithine family transaminase [Candidatus Altiarchaeota archaeon]|nr:acetylornithine/succinylornithine family transaminase [Candidatus Altiarchaeota archaeon]
MDYNDAVRLEKKYFAQLFDRLPLLITSGKDVYVFDSQGKKYLDIFSGVAVSSVGHAHPAVVKAIKDQAGKLIHASNWVYTEPQLELAEKLTKLTGLERVFYSNDGAGAVEASLKLARSVTGKKEIISMEKSFHGRTFGALSATWSEKYRKPFMPLVPGFKFAKYNDIESLKKEITDDTAAVIVEPILGEAGVIIPDDNYLQQVRELTQKKGALLIVDEIQTGFGRTGEWFEYKRAKIKPDILLLAKGLGGGFPVGAILYSGFDYKKGEHGGTFNGSPLACTIAKTVIEIIEKEKLVVNSKKTGKYLIDKLKGYKTHGRGLMIGLDVDDGKKQALKLIENGLIPIYSGNTLRILPPLTLKREHADNIIRKITEVIPK